MKKQVELSITHNGKNVVAYPYTKKEHVQFENGMNIDEFVGQDIATPTITHNTTAIKVGVGDSDVSSSVVDSTVNMTIKGQTYQNILPDPTLRNEMQGKSMQRLNEGYDSIETVDGVSKSAILKGQTLVNGLSNPIIKVGGECVVILSPTHLLINHGENTSGKKISVSYDWLGGKMRDGADYTLDIWILKNTMRRKDNPTERIGKINFNNYNTGYYSIPTGKTGHIVYEVTTPTTSTTERPYIETFTTCEGELEIQMVIREGKNLIPIEQHFEGMASCKMPVLTTYNSNIFPFKEYIEGTEATEDEDYIYVNGVFYQFIIPLETDGNIYTIYVDGEITKSDNFGEWTLIYEDGTERGTYLNLSKKSVDTLNKKLVGLKFRNPFGAVFKLKKSSLCFNLKTMGQEPYKTNILRTPEEVVLKGLGDIQDTLNINTGEYVQRIGEVTLNGSENWLASQSPTENRGAIFKLQINDIDVNVKNDNVNCQSSNTKVGSWSDILNTNTDKTFAVLQNKELRVQFNGSLEELKTWLSESQPKLQYLKTPIIKTVDLSILDQNGGTQENLHSFANGHLQVSSEAENSLLPTVQYEIPTKNSYHMDLMKTNTLYTMKAKSVSGTFTIDDTSYNVNANGTFTSPSSMTNKLLVMSNKTNEEVMLLEGNVIDKTIPYFKGIKSAFEGEDKIEVLSTGKNLFDKNKVFYGKSTSGNGELIDSPQYVTSDLISVKPNTNYTVKHLVVVSMYDKNGSYIGGLNSNHEQRTFTTPSNCSYIRIRNWELLDTVELQKEVLEKTVLQEGDSIETYEPYKSNSTKIPLLSPLRSLPNGVCDELIIDRLNHKAKLIQRIGYEVLNENTAFSSYPTMEKEKTLLFQTQNANPQGASTYCISDHFIHRNSLWDSSDSDTEAIMIGGGEGNIGKRIDFRISKAKVSTNNVTILQDYLSKEPITVLYQLNIPIITEIDLEGYPYVYKGGHIFLNSDIAPTTQITYSINQAQQIESANENLQRHEKEISHLQKLIAQYIQVEYESTLLSLKI